MVKTKILYKQLSDKASIFFGMGAIFQLRIGVLRPESCKKPVFQGKNAVLLCADSHYLRRPIV